MYACIKTKMANVRCCVSLRSGALMIVLLETAILTAISLAFTTVNIFPHFSMTIEATVTNNNGTFQYPLIGDVVPITDHLLSLLLVIFCDLQLIVNGFAIYGVVQRSVSHLSPWLITNSIYFAIAVKSYLGLALFAFINFSVQLAVCPLIVMFVMLAVCLYLLLVVKAFRKEIKEKDDPNDEIQQLRIKVITG